MRADNPRLTGRVCNVLTGVGHVRSSESVSGRARTQQLYRAEHKSWLDDRLAVSSGLHQIPTGSLSRLRRTRLTAKHEEEPWIRRTTTFSLPPPNSEIELAERIHAL